MKNTRIKKSILFFLTAFLIVLVGVAAILFSPSKSNPVETADAAETMEGSGLVEETATAVPYAATTVPVPVFYAVDASGKETPVNGALGKQAVQYNWVNDSAVYNAMIIKPFDSTKMTATSNNANLQVAIEGTQIRLTIRGNIWSGGLNTYYVDIRLTNKYSASTGEGDVWADDASGADKRYHYVSDYCYIDIPNIVKYNDQDNDAIDNVGRKQTRTYNAERAYFAIEGNSILYAVAQVHNNTNNTNYTVTDYVTFEAAANRIVFWTQTVAEWRIMLRPANTSYMRWRATNTNADMYYYFTLQRATVELPRIIDTTDDGKLVTDTNRLRVDYNNSAHTMYISASQTEVTMVSWNGTATSWTSGVPVVSKEGKSSTKNINALCAPAQNAGTYTLRVRLVNTTNYQWSDGTTVDLYFYLEIQRAKADLPEFYQGTYKLKADGTREKDSQGNDIFEWKLISGNTVNVPFNPTEDYSFKLTNVYQPDKMTNAIGAGSFKSNQVNSNHEWIAVIVAGAAAGTYRLDLTPTANYAWEPGGATAALQYTITIEKCTVDPLTPYEGDDMEGYTLTYNYTTTYEDGGKTVYLGEFIPAYMATSFSFYTAKSYNGNGALSNGDINSGQYGVSIDSAGLRLALTFKVAGQYVIDIGLRNGTSFQWLGGGTSTLRYTITVTPKTLESPKYYQIITGADGKEERKLLSDSTVDIIYGQTAGVTFEAEGLDNARITPSSSNTSYLSVNFVMDASGQPTNRVRMTTTAAAGYNGNATIEGDVCATYSASFAIKALSYISHLWLATNSNSNQVFYIRVVKQELEQPVYYMEEGTQDDGSPKYVEIDNDKQVIYTGTPYRLRFAPYYSTNSAMNYTVTVPSGSNGATMVTNQGGELILNVTNANVFTITLTVTKYYKWVGTAATSRAFTFTIQRAAVPDPTFYYLGDQYADLSDTKLTEITGPQNPYVEYRHGTHLYGVIKGVTSTNFNGPSATTTGSGTAIAQMSWSGSDLIYRFTYGRPGTYTIVLTPNANYCWAGGSTQGQTYQFTINKGSVKIPEIKAEDDDTDREVVISSNTNNVIGYEKRVNAAYSMTRSQIPAKLTIWGGDSSGTYNLWYRYDSSGSWSYQSGISNWDNNDASTGARYVAVQTNNTVAVDHDNRYYVRIYLFNTTYYQWDDRTTGVITYHLNQIRQTAEDPVLNYVDMVEESGGEDDAPPKQVEKLTPFNTLDQRVYRPSGYQIRVSNAPYNRVNVTASGTQESNGAAIGNITNAVKTPTDTDFTLTFITSGTYTITVAIYGHTSWTGGVTTAKTYTFVITRQEYTIPALQDCDSDNPLNKTVIYDAAASNRHYLAINTLDGNTNTDIYNQLSVSKNNNFGAPSQDLASNTITFTATSALNYSTGAYTVTLSMRDAVNYKFADGTTSKTYNLFVQRRSLTQPTLRQSDGLGDGGGFTTTQKTVTYTGKTLSMIIDGLNTTEFSWSYPNTTPTQIQDVELDDGGGIDQNAYRFYGTNSATYTVRISLRSDNYQWVGGARNYLDIVLVIDRATLALPVIDDPRAISISGGMEITVPYTGSVQSFTITGVQTNTAGDMPKILRIDQSGITVPTQTEANKVTAQVQNVNTGWYVRFYIDNGNYRWEDDLRSDTWKYCYFKVTAQSVELPTIDSASVDAAKKNYINRDELVPDDEGTLEGEDKYVVKSSDPFLHDTAYVVNNTLYSEYLGLVNREEIRINGWQSFIINAQREYMLDVTWSGGNNSLADNEHWTTDTNKITIKARVAATYTFTFKLKNGNYKWSDGTTGNQSIIFVIAPTTITTPHIEGSTTPLAATLEYKTDEAGVGVTQTIKITPADQRLIRQTVTVIGNEGVWSWKSETDKDSGFVTAAWGELTATKVATYRPVLQLIDKTNYKWQDGTNNDITYTLTITQKKLATPKYYRYEMQQVEILGEDGKGTGKFKEEEVAVPISGTTYTFDFTGETHKLLLTGIDPNYLNYNAVSPAANGAWSEPATNTDGNLVFGAKNVAYTNTNYNYIASYSMTIIIKDKANFMWMDGNNTTDRTYTFTINRMKVSIPTIVDNSASTNMYYKYFMFDNEQHDITLQNVDFTWVTYAPLYNEAIEGTPEERNGNELYFKSATPNIWNLNGARENQPAIVLSLKQEDNLNIQWTDGNYRTSTKTYYLQIQRRLVAVPTVLGANTAKYTGSAITFQIQNVLDISWMYWITFRKDNRDVTLDNITHQPSEDQGYKYELDTKTNILSITVPADVATYYIAYRINGYNYSNTGWSNQTGNNWYYDKGIYLYVQKAQLAIPSIDGVTGYRKTVTYDGTPQTFDIVDYVYTGDNNLNNWERLSVTTALKFHEYAADLSKIGEWDAAKKLLKLTATAVGSYTLRISTTANAQFTDGSTYKDYTLVIDKKMFTSPTFKDDKVGTTTADRKTVVYNFTDQTAVIENIVENNQTSGSMYVVNNNNTNYLTAVYDQEKGTLTLTARNVGTYYIDIYIRDTVNTRWSTTTGVYIRYAFVISKASLTIPSAVKTPIVDTEYFSGNNKYVTYSGKKYTLTLKDIDKTYMDWVDGTNYAGKADDHKAVLVYDDNAHTLSITAQYVYTYRIDITLKECPTNTQWISNTVALKQYYFYITQFAHAYPRVASGTATSVQYSGTNQNFSLNYVYSGSEKYEMVTTNKMAEVSWTKEGMLTLSAKEVGTYQVKVSIIDTESTTWSSTSSKSLTFTFYITKRTVQAEIKFSSAIPSVNSNISENNYRWPSGVPVYATVNLTGLASAPGETIALHVYVYRNGYSNIKTDLKETSAGSRQYLLPMAPEYTNPVISYYYIVAEHDAEANKTDNYSMSTVSVRFYIDSIATTFTENDISWQYTVGGGAANLIGVGPTHNTAEKAFEIEYQGKEIKFSLYNTDDDLKNKFVRIVSYDGDISATDSKSTTYCVSVTIGTTDSAKYFPNTTYYLYYKINKAKFNLSQIAWDYSSPFTYDGSAKNVKVEGLPEGLSISSYTGDRNRINATEGTNLHYNTSVTFTVSNDNYLVPEQGKENTYNGSFNWTCTWDIEKASIHILWKDVMKVDLGSLSIIYVPVLTTGDEMVTYKYSKRNASGTYESVPNVSKSYGETAYFSVEAVLKSDYTSNYKLVEGNDTKSDNPHLFEVGAESYAVVMHLELNGKTGDTFVYTGSGYKAVAVIDDDGSGEIEAETTKLTYYSVSASGAEQALGADQLPTNVGKYKVKVEINFWIAGNDDNKMKGQNEFEFEIVKGVIDTSKYVWQMEHGGKTYTYDADQGKWVDYYNAEALEFPYDGEAYNISLTGHEDGDWITFSNSGSGQFTGTKAGKYNAVVSATYDENNWEKPEFAWEKTMSATNDRTFTWEIAKHKIDATMVKWDYTGPFTYSVDSGSQAKSFSVSLINLPKDLEGKITYKTGTSAGNSASAVGIYKTSFEVQNIDTSNYEVVFSDTVKNPLEWEISKRIITAPEANGSWTSFDGNEHEIAKVLGLPADWENYFTVEMEIDGVKTPFTSGYKAKDAGTYSFTFKLKDGLNKNVSWSNGDGVTTNDQKTSFTVSPSVVTVAGWNAAGKNSTVILNPEGTNPDIFNYEIYKVEEPSGTETKVTGDNDPVWKTGNALIRIKPVLKEEHKKNVTVVFPDGSGYEVYEFRTDFPNLVRLDKPRMAGETSIEYDGKSHTFTIGGWEEYTKYLDIWVGDSKEDISYLTQTKAGTYEFVLKFKDEVVRGNTAAWKTTDGSNDVVQTDVTLSFEITMKIVPLPAIGNYVYTGSQIDIAAVINKQCGEDFVNISGTAQATAPGNYTATVALKDADSCIWADVTTASKQISWAITAREFSSPNGDGWTIFDGEIHDLSAVCGLEDGYKDFFDITIRVQQTTTDDEGAETTKFVDYAGLNGDKLMAKDAGVYEVTFTFKATATGARWDDQTREAKTAIVSVAKYVINVSGWNKNNEDSTVIVEGGFNNKFFEYQIWQDTDDVGEDGTTIRKRITAAQVATAGAGKTFYVNIAVLPEYDGNVEIIYADSSYESYSFTTKMVELMKPKIQNPSYDSSNPDAAPYIIFTGDPFTFVLQGWDSVKNYLEIPQSLDYLTQTNVGEYYITIRFKEGAAAMWSSIDGGGTADLILKFEIKPLELEKPKIADIAYDGKEHEVFAELAAEYGDYVKVISGNKGTNAGRYELVLRLAKNYDGESFSNANCVWKNGNATDLKITWNIKETELPTPANNGKWKTYDGEEHNIFDLLGLPANWAIYLDLTAEFNSTSLSAEDCTKAVKAGTYKLTFKLKEGLNPGGAKNVVFVSGSTSSTDPVTVEFTVEKLVINVTGWNRDMADSTVIISGSEDLLAFISYYFTQGGRQVDRAVVDAATDGTEFKKVPQVDEDNVELKFADGVEQQYTFTVGVPDVVIIERLAYPKMVYSKLAYTGERLTFAIANWIEYYSLYLEIADGNLMQTDIGTYSVTLKFRSDTDATWDDADYTRDSYTLTFEIYDQGMVQVQKPTLKQASQVYTGSALDFEIVAWEYLSQYVEIVSGDELTQTEIGVYKLVFRFKDGISAMWADDHTADDYTLYFEIVEETHNYIQISKPHFVESVKTHTGAALTFEIDEFDYYARFFVISGDSFTQTEIGKYSVTFTFRDDAMAVWIDGSKDDYTVYFEIREAGSVEVPEAGVKLPKPVIDLASVKIVDGKPQFKVANWDEYSEYIEMVEGSLTQIEAGKKYSVQFRIKDDANATWIDGTKGVVTITFEILTFGDPSEITTLPKPIFDTAMQVYNGREFEFYVINISIYREFFDITGDSLVQSEVGEYSITFTLKDGYNITWTDGTTDAYTLTFSIKARTVSGNLVIEDGVPKFAFAESADGMVIPEGVVDIVIKDANGKIVSAKDIKADQDYTVTLSINPTYADSYVFAPDLRLTYTIHKNADGDLGITGSTTEQLPGGGSGTGGGGNITVSADGGLDGPFLYISIGLGVVLLVFLMAIIGIVCFELKSKSKAAKASAAAAKDSDDDDDEEVDE